MTRSLGQVAFEARWAFAPNKHAWSHVLHETQRRYEEAAQAVLTEPCDHVMPIIYQLKSPDLVRLFWCRGCGAHCLVFGARQADWVKPNHRNDQRP